MGHHRGQHMAGVGSAQSGCHWRLLLVAASGAERAALLPAGNGVGTRKLCIGSRRLFDPCPLAYGGSFMSVLEELRRVEQQVLARLRELRPLVGEYEQLTGWVGQEHPSSTARTASAGSGDSDLPVHRPHVDRRVLRPGDRGLRARTRPGELTNSRGAGAIAAAARGPWGASSAERGARSAAAAARLDVAAYAHRAERGASSSAYEWAHAGERDRSP